MQGHLEGFQLGTLGEKQHISGGLKVLEDFLSQLCFFSTVVHSIAVPFVLNKRLLDKFRYASPLWSPPHFLSILTICPSDASLFLTLLFQQNLQYFRDENMKKPITHCCVFSKNNPSVLVSTVWCTEQTVRGRGEHLARVQHPGLHQQETGRAECSDGLEVTLLEVSKSPFGTLTICSTWCSFPYWFRSLMHPLWIYSDNTSSNMLHSTNKVFFFFCNWKSKGFPCNCIDDLGPSGTFQPAFKVKSRCVKPVYAHLLSTDRNGQSGKVVKKDSFGSVFFLTLAPSWKRHSVALKATGDRNLTDSDPTRDTAYEIFHPREA